MTVTRPGLQAVRGPAEPPRFGPGLGGGFLSFPAVSLQPVGPKSIGSPFYYEVLTGCAACLSQH